MNKVFRKIWSKVKSAWVIVAEIVSSNGGPSAVTVQQAEPKSGRWIISTALQASLVASLLTLFAPFAEALPTNPQVIHGTANIQTSGNMMNITNSPNAIINWGSFSIANNETARFIQQSSTSSVLNRVIGGDPSRIFGALQSNGRVFLINQNGILIGAGARIDVAGLAASTLNLSNQDFLAGRLQFADANMAGKIENQGVITTPEGGQVYLIAPDVTNKGTITAPNGDVLLAAGKDVLLIEKTTPEIAYVISAPEDQALNLGTIAADVGRVGMYGSMVRNSGNISADSATSEGGKIYLRATKKLELAETSSITADGAKGGEILAITAENGTVTGDLIARGNISAKGDGSPNSSGFVETSAANLDLHGVEINTNGGTWLIDPADIVIGDTNAGGNITGENLGNALKNNSVKIQTTDPVGCTAGAGTCPGFTIPGGGGPGDIIVLQPVDWNTDNTLTMEAYRHIEINKAISGTHAGSTLKLLAGTSGSSGKITQANDAAIKVFSLNATAQTGIELASANNEVQLFTATNNSSGDILLNNVWNQPSDTMFQLNDVSNHATNGAITITSDHAGIKVNENQQINSRGGKITLNGTNTNQKQGVRVDENARISSNGGDIEITGTGGAGDLSASTPLGNTGVYAFGSSIDASSSGSVTITGRGGKGADGDATQSYLHEGGSGVDIRGGSLGTATIIGEKITISGEGGAGGEHTGSNLTRSGGGGIGVYIQEDYNNLTINAAEKLEISGRGGNGAAGYDGKDAGYGGTGVFVYNINENALRAGTEVIITGNGGQGGSGSPPALSSYGGSGVGLTINYAQAVPLTIEGTRGADGTDYTYQAGDHIMYAVEFADTKLQTMDQDLTITGNGAAVAGSDYNIYIHSTSSIGVDNSGSTAGQTGNISFEGDLLNLGHLGVAADSEIEVDGNYSQKNPNPAGHHYHGNLYVALKDTSTYSKLDVSGDADLAGDLHVAFDGGYTPTAGDAFEILTTDSGTISGNFDTVLPPFGYAGNQLNFELLAGNKGAIKVADNADPPGPGPQPPQPEPPEPEPYRPTIEQCIANPSAAGCTEVLPSLDTCTKNPTAPGCSVVLPSMDTCTKNPTTPGCTAVLPSMDTCVANPSAPGCTAVLPSLDTCTANPTAPGCSVVLPSMDTCIANPSAAGCTAVLPSLDTCTANPTAPGCSVVLPSMDTCVANPSAPGCTAVLPSLDTCTANPTAPGCSVVLPSLDACTANPTAPGCSAVLPSMDTCVANPSAPGCTAVLPSLDACTLNPKAPGCSVVLPSMDTCMANPSAPGCKAVLPSMDACTLNPKAPGCSVVLPSVDTCEANPSLPGCSVVLPSRDECVVNPSTPGCSAVLPKQELRSGEEQLQNQLGKDTQDMLTDPTVPAGLKLVGLIPPDDDEEDDEGGGDQQGLGVDQQQPAGPKGDKAPKNYCN